MPSLLGIDNGLTVTKAVIFDVDGTELAVARRRVPQSMPAPHRVERDMDALWQATAEAIAEAVLASGRPASDITRRRRDGARRRPLPPGPRPPAARPGDPLARQPRRGRGRCLGGGMRR